ncbi:uncharacterized protein LOC114273392 isoform X3 [Camellia sinensis]|uniref:uncharacterized protein LOC114273392 isoform X3 n=1 Tax=Camellia sinensis TaxID=4442 RepID=UPI001035ACD8|nr:uncharacterized protein LOC114273392 isoform X3 [Camellia sinensis]
MGSLSLWIGLSHGLCNLLLPEREGVVPVISSLLASSPRERERASKFDRSSIQLLSEKKKKTKKKNREPKCCPLYQKGVCLLKFGPILFSPNTSGELSSYQHTKYHKQTKNQWARDDPAFIVICCLLLAVSTLAYCAAYDHSVSHAVFVIIAVLVFHFLLVGVVLATCCWFLTNNYLREEAPNSHVVEQRVEWQVWELCTSHFIFCADSLCLGLSS